MCFQYFLGKVNVLEILSKRSNMVANMETVPLCVEDGEGVCEGEC